MIRAPAVAGQFYPADPADLKSSVEECLVASPEPRAALAILVPHAGYKYSGGCAGRVYSRVMLPASLFLLCPNHTGEGAPVAVMSKGSWRTPLGDAPIDNRLAEALLSAAEEAEADDRAHRREHSLEVQLPFLQVVRPGFRFVPVCVGTQRHDSLIRLGDALCRVIRDAGRPTGIVISSDMSHYISADRARELDSHAIEAMEALDPDRLHEVVAREEISMCGIAPAVAGIQAARSLGAVRGRLVEWTHSGQTTGDFEQVVSYAGLVFD